MPLEGQRGAIGTQRSAFGNMTLSPLGKGEEGEGSGGILHHKEFG
jgi:hypothetical protein